MSSTLNLGILIGYLGMHMTSMCDLSYPYVYILEVQQPDDKGGGVFVGVGSGIAVAGNAGRAALGFVIGGPASDSAAGLFEGLARGGLASATWAFILPGL